MQSKQFPLHPTSPFRPVAALCAALCFLGIAGAGMPALGQSRVVPQSGAQMSVLRLIAAGGLRDGRYEAGVDLTMAPGSHTYWKIPGEAGVPPVFTFNGSDNVASATVEFPAPKRISEEGIEAYGYADNVVFPVVVTPVDAGKPAVLHVDVTYAVCNKICLPGHDEATLTLKPHGAPVDGEALAAARAKVPRPISAAPQLAIARVAGKPDPAWTLRWAGADAPQDIFADAPDGFFFDTRKTGDTTWTMTAQQSVTAPKSPTTTVTLVLARQQGSTSVKETFDLDAAK